MRGKFILILCASAIAFALAAVLATAQEAPKPPDLTQLLVQRTNQLGVCNSELGQLQQLQAAVIAGQLVSPQSVKETFEKANPGKTLGTDLKIEDIQR